MKNGLLVASVIMVNSAAAAVARHFKSITAVVRSDNSWGRLHVLALP